MSNAILRRFGLARVLTGSVGIQLAFFLALGLLGLSAAVSYRSVAGFIESARWVDHTNEVRVGIEEFESSYYRIHVPWRNALLRGEATDFAEFTEESQSLLLALENLKRLTRDSAAHQARLKALERLVTGDIAALSASISKKLAGEVDDPLSEIEHVATHGLRRYEVEQLSFDIRSEEERLLASRRREWDEAAHRATTAIVAGGLAGFALLIAVFVLLRRENRIRRAAQEQAQRHAREVEDLYNHAPCGYHSLDRDGFFVRINDTELKWLGYTREEVIGKKRFSDLVTPGSARIFHENFPRLKETGEVHDLEFDLVRRDGTLLPVALSATAVRDAEGRFVMTRSTVFDISERRRVADALNRLNAELGRRAVELEAANRELESFSYSVSHDLRSPLRAIDGFACIFEEDYADQLDEEGKRLLKVIRDNSRKMGQLIDDLLAFSRLGRKPLAVSTIDMTEQVKTVFGEITNDDRRTRLELEPLPQARGDPALVRQVWHNLLANAVKFSGKRPDPLVTVTGHSGGGENVYCVRDNGVGFDMRYYDKLFGVFQRLHDPEEYPGTGVGLAIVQRVVARHGGRVWAESEEGRGAAFYFTLPGGGHDG